MTEARVARSHDRLRTQEVKSALANATTVGSVVADNETKYIEVNREYRLARLVPVVYYIDFAIALA